jgi:hypothetical protein
VAGARTTSRMDEPQTAGQCHFGRPLDLHNLLTETSVGNRIEKPEQSINETAILVRNPFRTLTSVRTEAALAQAMGDGEVSQLLRSLAVPLLPRHRSPPPTLWLPPRCEPTQCALVNSNQFTFQASLIDDGELFMRWSIECGRKPFRCT